MTMYFSGYANVRGDGQTVTCYFNSDGSLDGGDPSCFLGENQGST